MNKSDPLNCACHIIGGKEYDWGNWIMVYPHHRMISIEFDSDYDIRMYIGAKNFRKKAAKVIAAIPNPVTVEWFVKHGWDVPEEIR